MALIPSPTAPIRSLERARSVQAAADGQSAPAIAASLGCSRPTAHNWIRRYSEHGLDALEERRRSGRPPTYPAEQRAEVVATTLTAPPSLGLPFASWAMDRLQVYLGEQKALAMKRSRIGEILVEEGPRWRQQGTWFGERRGRGSTSGWTSTSLRKGAFAEPDTAPPDGSVVVCLGEMGPGSAKSFRGSRLVHADPGTDEQGQPRPAERAKQGADHGRRGKGSIFGAFRPATGEALTAP